MKTSTDRILTTHVGSLPRPADLVAFLNRKEKKESYDDSAFRKSLSRSVDDVVQKQVRTGIDIVSDGEMSKISYATYLKDRLNGFDGIATEYRVASDLADYMTFARRLVEQGGTERSLQGPACNAPLTVKDATILSRDVKNFRSAIARHKPLESFMTAASPGVVSVFLQNQYYATEDDYLNALSAILKKEYEAISQSGLILQIDCPDLAMGRHIVHSKTTNLQFRDVVARNIEILNAATANISPELMRLHLCWGNYEGPHHHDIPLGEILDLVYNARPQAISLEGANPRHAHEWRVFERHALPDDKIIIPGVIDSTSNFIEHPELIAQRIVRYAEKVGRDRVIAGSDCGFATFAERPSVDPEIAWAKLAALAEGAGLASKELW